MAKKCSGSALSVSKNEETTATPNDKLQYDLFTNMLVQQNVLVDASEIQGILCGMLAGGMNLDDQEWIEALADVVHQGDTLPKTAEAHVVLMFNRVCQELVEADFALQMCLPDDSTPINERGKALVNWVHGFLLGFGLHQNDLTNCSDEVKEGLEDLSQIAKMDEKMDEDETSEHAFVEVVEYVRISAMLCFNEMGKSLIDSRQQSPSIH